MKELLKKILPRGFLEAYRYLKYNVLDGYALKSYSQEGEDMVLHRIFEGRESGFYIDIGAHHPKRFSNTYFFYKRGWFGINIEPNSEAIKLFKKYRASDINIEAGVSDQAGELTYFIFNEPALNSFDKDLSETRASSTNYYIIDRKKTKVNRLDAILAEYLPKKVSIDFMCIDAEGYDLNILKSNDWELYRPKCLLVESLESYLSNIVNHPVHQYLIGRDYDIFAKTFNTLFYVDVRRQEVIKRGNCRDFKTDGGGLKDTE